MFPTPGSNLHSPVGVKSTPWSVSRQSRRQRINAHRRVANERFQITVVLLRFPQFALEVVDLSLLVAGDKKHCHSKGDEKRDCRPEAEPSQPGRKR
jgi:hypothetical protein